MKVYKHIFFDLDKTLWDFERNSKELLSELYNEHSINTYTNATFENFHSVYIKNNNRLWEDYRNGKISKEFLSIERFNSTLMDFKVDQKKLAREISEEYVLRSPLKTHLFPNTFEILAYLKSKYSLHIITNGFAEIQHRKLSLSGIDNYFTKLFISEEVGYKKPDTKIFHHCVSNINSVECDCLMIGDDLEVDILGARAAGIDQVFVNFEAIKHNEEITFEVFSLIELKKIL